MLDIMDSRTYPYLPCTGTKTASSSPHSYSYSPSPSSSPVGTLSTWDPETGISTHPLKIYSDEEVFVGRDGKRCQYAINNPFISNKHLRIYTILFDRENPSDVAPLVYAQDLSLNGTLWNDIPMGKGNGSFLLSDGDTLRLSPGIILRFQQCPDNTGNATAEGCFDALQRAEMKIFKDQYAITPRKLGSGAYGRVHMAIDKEGGRQLACKIVDLRMIRRRIEKLEELKQKSSRIFQNADGHGGPSIKISKGGTAKLVAVRQMGRSASRGIREKLKVYDREARVLERLCHPNIIGVEKVIKSENTIYLFQDLVTAGDLFSFIEYKGGKVGGIEAAVIIRQVLMALDYLHDRNIVHRDLKPDNILMTSLADGCRVVLTDFGCARRVKPDIERMSTVIGTFEYSAPEVLKQSRQGYTKAVDLWSLGCITVVLLTGGSPFLDPATGAYSDELAQKCDLKRLEADLEWHKAGKRAKDFVHRLLVLDETKRMKVKQALSHCWFTNPIYKRELEELYDRSVRDWKPRPHRGSLIVELGKFSGVDRSQEDPFSDTASDSSLPEDSSIHSRDREGCDPYDGCSTTLSDPELPAFHRKGKMEEKFQLPQERKSQFSPVGRLPFSSDAWMKRNGANHSALGKHKGQDGPSMMAGSETRMTPTLGMPNIESTDRRENPPQLLPIDMEILSTINSGDPRMTGKKSRAGSNDPHCHDSDFEDQVYEEVDNLITGERQRVIYGMTTPAEARMW